MIKPVFAIACTFALVACDSTPKSDPRADSLAAVAAERARIDSIEAIQLVTVDTGISPKLGIDLSKMEKTGSGLYMLDRKRGSGPAADSGKYVDVHYTTYFVDGTVIDDKREKGKPHRILLGFNEVVKAWEEGNRGMRPGGRRVLVSPPSLAYGKAGKPGFVPRLSTLVFEVELVRVH